jgi:hypothetical protein
VLVTGHLNIKSGIQLTCPAKIIPEVGLSNILTRDGARVRAGGDGLLADGKTDHRREVVKLMVLGSLASSVADDVLVDVLRSVVAVVHGTAAALDAGPLGDVASCKVELVVGSSILKLQAVGRGY